MSHTKNIKPIQIASINKVSKTFTDLKAVYQVSLDINQGEVLSILGPNGAGKTTLINMMLGRLSLTEGEINILGFRPGEIELKRLCGAMLQVTGLPDMSTVKEHLTLFQSYYPQPMDYQRVITLAGLNNIQDKYCKNLSGGQKQRLLFGLSICGNPKLLFLDEPSVGMDIKSRKSLWNTIDELRSSGTSIILTTHYLEEADHLSDRIIMLNHGQVIYEGTPEYIKANVNYSTVKFLSSMPIELFKQINSKATVKKTGKYFEIQTNNSISTLKQLFSITDDISNLSVTGAALEDAFLFLNQESEYRSNKTAEASL